MPTIPSPRDGPPTSGRSSSAKAFTRSPGRTYSMSRLDQLAQPRKRPTELSTLTEQQSQPLSASSMSRSMSHLAASGGKSLKRSDNSRSMGTLPGAVPMPRPTRAERLRRKAREHQNQQQQGKIVLVHSTRWYSLSLSFNEILLMYRYDIVDHRRRDMNHWFNRCFFCAQYYRGYDKLDGDDSLYFTPNFDSLASLPPPISRFAFPFVFGIWNGDLIGLESGCARHQFVVVVPYNLSWVHMCMRTNAVRSHCESIRRKILATLRILFVRFREKDG